jgi:hypothetical protein
MVRMRIIRRFSHYNVGEVIAVTLAQGRDLDVRRLAAPLDILVPTPAPPPPEAAPQRQPGATVRK